MKERAFFLTLVTITVLFLLLVSSCSLVVNNHNPIITIQSTVTTEIIRITSTKPLSTSTPDQTLTPTITINVPTTIPEATINPPTSIPSPTLAVIQGKLSDLVINYSTHFIVDCSNEDMNQIWLSSFPYKTIRPLLFSQGVDYNFPQWSPDGAWIAYIVSKPSDWDGNQSTKITGTDSIWLIRPDGTEKHRISSYLPRANFRDPGGGCTPVKYISNPIIWSPNGKYIIFRYDEMSNTTLSSFYIVDVNSGETQLLFNGKRYYHLTWLPESNVAIFAGDEEDVSVLNVVNIKEYRITTIPFPLEIKPNTSFKILKDYGYLFGRYKNTLFGVFVENGNNSNPQLTLWRLDASNGEWRQIINLPGVAKGNIILGNHWIVACEANSIDIMNPENWGIVGAFQFSGNGSLDCEQVDITQDASGNDIIGFAGYRDITADQVVEDDGIWVARLQSRNLDPKPYLVTRPPSIGPYTYDILNYSWKP